MSVTVTRTKIQVPRRRPDLLYRSRLVSRFDDVLDYPFTLISAPAGYGKTSLMIDVAQKADYPVCWYSIDPLDLDPNRFLTHLIHSIRIQFPAFGNKTLSLLDSQANPLKDTPQLISTLINEIYKEVSEHFVIFLDDFHHLNPDPGLCNFISRFGQEMDDNSHLVMASRILFDFPDLSLLIGRRMVKGIGFDELAFQAGEIKSYYREILKREITEEEAKTLYNMTEGWITGLVFSVDTDLAHLPGSGKKGRIASSDLFQYLAEQVLEKQAPQVQDFLLRTSLFDEFNPEICDLLLREVDSKSCAETYASIQRKNLFIQQVGDDDTWIQYHALFRDFLRSRFHEKYPDEEKKLLHNLLDHYLELEDWEKAFAITKQIGNPGLMAQVIDQANSSLIHQGRIELLSSWLEILPKEGFDTLPKLIIIRGICYTSRGKPKKGLTYINNSINLPKIAGNSKLLTRALLCRITTYRLLGLYGEALNDVEYIFNNLIQDVTNEKLLAETYREAALANFNIGNFTISNRQFNHSLNIYTSIKDINNQVLVHQDLGLLFMEHGFLTKAASHFHSALKTCEITNNPTQLSNILNNIGALRVLTGNFKESSNALHSAMNSSNLSLNSRIHAFILATKGDLAKSILLNKTSLEHYEKANIISEQIQDGFLLSYLAINKAIVLRYLSKITKSETCLQIAHAFLTQRSSRNELGQWHLEKGFHLLALGEHESSGEAFTRAAEIFDSTGKQIELALSRMGLVLRYMHRPKSRQLDRHLKEWITSLDQLETNQPLLPELNFQGQGFVDFLKTVPPNKSLDKLLVDLGQYRKRLPRLQMDIFPDQDQIQGQEDKLEIYALGKNQVLSQGEKISSPEWIYQKTVRELFFYLLTVPRGATKEQIGLVFWPDSSHSQLNCQFKNALYRLRRSVGRDVILYDNETRTYKFNKDLPHSYDVEIFLAAIQKAEKELTNKERVINLEKAVALYSHPYSPQLGGVWAEPIRQSISRKYEQALLTLAENKLDQNKNEDCLKFCKKILVIESCQEKAYQMIMKAYSNLDDRNGILRTYSVCRDNLNKIYNIEPSSDTQKLLEFLIA